MGGTLRGAPEPRGLPEVPAEPETVPGAASVRQSSSPASLAWEGEEQELSGREERLGVGESLYLDSWKQPCRQAAQATG